MFLREINNVDKIPEKELAFRNKFMISGAEHTAREREYIARKIAVHLVTPGE